MQKLQWKNQMSQIATEHLPLVMKWVW